ncbi:MAG TPA: YfiR family protein [Tenuifilaceae bacterium]|nr:YfiR family protein [Tenuifilaceae bacterium]
MDKLNNNTSMKTRIFFPIILATFFLGSISVNAQSYKIQTAFVYQLTRLIDWCPSGKQGNFTIGLFGNDANMLNELNTLKGRKVAAQSIEIIQINDLSQCGTVNILFVSRTKTSELQRIISAVGSGCTLVVADDPGAASKGAAISFLENNGKIQFEVNKSYAQKHSLTINNKLIELASTVY